MRKLNFVARNFFPDSPGGCEKVFYELYKRAVNDYRVRIISGYYKKTNFPMFNSIFPHLKTKNAIFRYAYYTLNMTLRAYNRNCDLIHANNIECIRLSNKPFVLTIHHLGHLMYDKIRKQNIFTWFLRKMVAFQANRADKVITVSHNTKNDLKKIGVKPDKIVVIPNGIDLEMFKPAKKKKKTSKFIISHVSRISPEKAQHFSIEAIKRLPEKIREKIELHIIGFVSDKNYYDSLEKNKNIMFFLNLNDSHFAKKIAQSDLVVFPTMMSEGFGLVVLEAMACGVPVIASDQESIREAGGDVCQYFKQGSVKEFVENIVKLYENKKLRKSLSRKGLEWVKNFSWEGVYKKHKRIYEELFSK